MDSLPQWVYHVIAWTWGGDGQGGPSSTGYLLTSGPLSSLPSYVAALAILWRLRCDEPKCWRLGKKPGPNHTTVCNRHYKIALPQPVWDAIPEVRAAYEEWKAKR